MHIQEINDKNIWNDFLLALTPNTFLQSWEWKQVQEQDGEDVHTLGFYEQENLVAVALLITVHAKRGVHYLCPHGPIVSDAKRMDNVLQQLVSYCRTKSDGAVALRIAPLVEHTSENQQLFSNLGFKLSPMHVHAELTWVLDISISEEELLASMRKTTRHAIAKAKKEHVRVDISSDISSLERFWPLYEQTKNRHGFVPFQKDFIASQATILGASNRMFFAIAKYNGEDVAAAMLFQFGTTVFYYHGASKKLPSSIPAAQLLQWEAIREAKKRGAVRYNFWGIAPEDEPKHPFAGITIFKKGFGGYAIDYLHAQDLPLSWKYWKLWAVEMFRKKQRGF